jgi:phospholipid/cholesterol/gamma-HCH transport system substrate-binding protein
VKNITGPAIKGAIFFVVTLLATVALGVTIANVGVSDTAGYSARFTDVTSVNPGDEVRMSGVRIGQVDSVKVVDRRLAEIDFSVDTHRKLSAAATVAIRYRNLVGQRYLAVDQGPVDVTAVLAPGAQIPLARTTPALDLTELFNGFKPLFQALSPDDVNQLSFEIVQVLQGEGSTLEEFLQHVGSLTSTLAGKDQLIGQVIGNLNSVLDTVNAKGDQLGQLVSTTDSLVKGLAADAKPIGQAVAGLGDLTTATADLLKQGRQPLKDSIDTLGALSKNLADNTPVFQQFITNLPVKYNAIGKLVSYGSWVNFYLCSATSDAAPAPGGPPVGLPVTAARCQ